MRPSRQTEAFRFANHAYVLFDVVVTSIFSPGVSGYCLWNYTPQSVPGPHKGDGWNREFLSIYSDCEAAPNSSPFDGGRALSAVIRPTPLLVAGRIRKFSFDGLSRQRRFRLEFEEADSCLSNETVVFLPFYQYGRGEEDGLRTRVSDGEIVTIDSAGAQRLVYCHSGVSPDKNGKKLHWLEVWRE